MKTFVFKYGRKIISTLKKSNLLNFSVGAIDMISLLVIFQISFMILEKGSQNLFLSDPHFRLLYLYMVPSWILILHICNIAQIPRTSRYSRLFYEYFQFTILNILILYIFYFIFRLESISHVFIFLFATIGWVILYSVRIFEYKIFKWYRARGHNYINIILIADNSAIPFIDDLLSKKEWGYRILVIFSDSKELKSKFGKRVKILPEKSSKTINNLIEIDIVDEVLYFKTEVNQADVKENIRSCEELGVVFRLKSKTSRSLITNAKISKIGNVSFLVFVNIPNNSVGLSFKTAMDIYMSFILIILLSPVMLFIAIFIMINSRGPVLFKQARVGLRGRQFYLYKFRTMVVNAEQLRKQLETQNEMDGPVFKIKDDPRVTSIGKVLRKTGLDELPQLFNVLKGEMSIIGPRPPLQSETRLYKRWHLRRLSVKPGITCSWQIIPDRNNIKFDHWMKLDLAYIDNWSPTLDFILLIKTIRTVIFGTGR